MASVIWESVGFIGTTALPKVRVKMNDGSNMIDSDDGVKLIEAVNGIGNIGFKDVYWSLGFGNNNFNSIDTFFNATQPIEYEGKIASIGSGMGVVTSQGVTSGITRLPYWWLSLIHI